MIDAIQAYVRSAGIGPKFDLSVGFVDVQTGQAANFDGQTRHFALSTFKGPLGAYYLWLAEQGKLTPAQHDPDHLAAMMGRSDNEATSCVFKRVGGLAGFNDWLAGQGLSRENNFIAQWENWACTDDRVVDIMPPDLRYFNGDKTLGLPGESTLQHCFPKRFACHLAFAPIELAAFYSKLYRGQVLTMGDTRLWLSWMQKDVADAALLRDLNRGEQARVAAYVKNGFSASGDQYPINFQHEAGILVTPYGAYALAVFTQGDPDWPGTEPLGAVGRIVYDYFTTVHGRPPGD
jgi:hypothetical protein